MGFFFADDKKKPVKRPPISDETLHKMECRACPLNHAKVTSPKMAPVGSSRPLLYVLGESPGTRDDEKGKPFSDGAGDVLRESIEKALGGWGIDGMVRFNNVIRTHPPKNRTPSHIEIECCRPSIIRDIENTKPKAILAVGVVALRWLLGDIEDKQGIAKWRGRRVPVEIGSHRCWLFPVLEPAKLIMQRKVASNGKEFPSEQERIFNRDISRAIKLAGKLKPLPKISYEECISGIQCFHGEGGDREIKKIESLLDELSKDPHVGYDIETDSAEKEVFRRLRPYGQGSRILSMAFGTPDLTVSVGLYHPEVKWTESQLVLLEEIILRFLRNRDCAKIAHNLPFEMEWIGHQYSRDLLRPGPWEDTMAQAFCLDERRGLHNLDVLCYLYFGVPLKSLSKVNVNRLASEPIEKVLLYNGLDAKFTDMLFEVQMDAIEEEGITHTYNELVRRMSTMVLTQMKGLHVNFNTVDRLKNEFEQLLADIVYKIEHVKEVREFKQTGAQFNPGSSQDVTKVFRDIIKAEGGRTPSGGYSVDEAALKLIDHPLSEKIIEYRGIAKQISTYIDPMGRDGKFVYPDDLLHPSLNTMVTATGRLSSDSPNEQNFPKHKYKQVRESIVPPKGYVLVSCDYGQIEFRVLAMASKDQRLVKALWERYDVHTEWGERIAYAYPRLVGGKGFLRDKDAMKPMRHIAKNKFVFPACYGAVPKSIAGDIGIPEHIAKRLWDDFFKDFPGIAAWHKKTRRRYEDRGYVECLTGRRRNGPLEGNKPINTPIQGTAADICIDAMNRISERAQREDNWDLQPCMNVHDDLTFALDKNRIDDDLNTIIDDMLDCPFSFVNVPIAIEVEMGDSWYTMKEVGSYFSDE